MAATIGYECQFFRPSEKGQGSGTLAYMTLKVTAAGKTIFESRDWQIRASQDGNIWPAPPQGNYKDRKSGATKYYRIISVWPGEETREARATFEKEVIRQYNDWKSGAPAGYTEDAPSTSAAPPPASPSPPGKTALPPGWTMNIDPESGRSYLTDPSNNSFWADDPSVANMLKPKAPPAPPRAPAGPPPSRVSDGGPPASTFARLPAAVGGGPPQAPGRSQSPPDPLRAPPPELD